MKQKKFNKKLTLSKQTITNLSSVSELSNEQKENLIGGWVPPETAPAACPTGTMCTGCTLICCTIPC